MDSSKKLKSKCSRLTKKSKHKKKIGSRCCSSLSFSSPASSSESLKMEILENPNKPNDHEPESSGEYNASELEKVLHPERSEESTGIEPRPWIYPVMNLRLRTMRKCTLKTYLESRPQQSLPKMRQVLLLLVRPSSACEAMLMAWRVPLLLIKEWMLSRRQIQRIVELMRVSLI